jgi:hypothetical protein
MSVQKIVVAIAILIGVPNLTLAQRTTAMFAGIVQDSTGAVLPGAEAELINEGTVGGATAFD